MKQVHQLGVMLCGLLLLSAAVFGQASTSGQEEVNLIKGVDGGLYEPYLPSVVQEVQTALQSSGLYQGDIDGELDEETMQAIAEYQKQNNLMVSGVPSPVTRGSLLGEG